MRKTYIYTLAHPLTREVKYIGKTVNPSRRLSEHCTKKNYNCKKSKWVKSILEIGLRPVLEILEETTVDRVNEIETYWISQFKTWGFVLVNTQLGGDEAPFKYKR